MALQRVAPLVPIISLQLMLAVSGSSCEDGASESCLADAPQASAGVQLMQRKHLMTLPVLAAEAVDAAEGEELPRDRRFREFYEARVACSREIGKLVPLNTDGYHEVAESCCFDDMKDFIRRTAGDMGMEVCHEGGLNGFSPFFSCNQESSFAQLRSEMERSRVERCPWLGPLDKPCAPQLPDCSVSLNPAGRPSILKGYMGIEAENNPPALIVNSAVKDRIATILAERLNIADASAVKTVIGTGPVGEPPLYKVSLKSRRTGKYVKVGSNGKLMATSAERNTFDALFNQLDNAFTVDSVGEGPLKWKKDAKAAGGEYFYFEAGNGTSLSEDENGRVTLSESTANRLQVDFRGFSLLSSSRASRSLHMLDVKRSCTVVVTYEVLQTDPPTLSESEISAAASALNPMELQSNISADLALIEPCLGALGISTFKFCQDKGVCDNKSLKPAHSDHEYQHVSDESNKTMPNGTVFFESQASDTE